MNTKLKPIPELDNLSEEKRDLLHDWLDHLGYRKTIEKLQSEWQLPITYNKLYRYYHRQLHKSAFDHLLDDKLSISDFLALLNGEAVPYDQTGIELIMKRAFDLTCARETNPSTLATLLRLFHYKTSREWNQRRLAQNDKRIEISDRLAKVREQELDLKRPTQSTEESEFAQACRFSAMLDHLFSNHPAVKAAQNSCEIVPVAAPNSAIHTPTASSPHSAMPASPNLINTGFQAGDSPLKEAPAVLTPSATAKPQPPCEAPLQCQMKNVQSSMPNERPDPATNEKTKSHAIRRWRSFIPRSFVSPEPDNSWIDECPCGQKLPCPHHRGLWREVRYVKPSDPDYASALARHGIPVYSPSVSELKRTPREAPDLNPK